MSVLKRIAAWTAVPVLLVALAGCGGSSGEAKSENKGPTGSGPIVALISDVSLSTKSQRAPGGTYEQGWMDTAKATALERGSLWASAADGQTLANSVWQVNGFGFSDPQVGSDLLKEAALKKQAEELLPEARKILSVNRKGSDLLGALQVASQLFSNYPDRPRQLVLLTDGGITTDGINVAKNLPMNEAQRKQAINLLRKNEALPDLTGGEGEPVRVWIGGLGHGIGKNNPAKTRAVIALWEDLIPAAQGDLIAHGNPLQLVNFP